MNRERLSAMGLSSQRPVRSAWSSALGLVAAGLGLVAAALALVAAGLALVTAAATFAGPARADAPRGLRTAVLSFEDHTADAALGPLAKGLTDMLTTDLAVLGELTLVERSRMGDVLAELDLQRKRGSPVDPKTAQKLGKLLGAELVVLGGVSALAPTLRLDARLVSVERGEVLATAKAEGPIDEFFRVEADLARALAKELGAALTRLQELRIDQVETRRLDALRAYGEGLDAADKAQPEAAKAAFKKALAADPDFAKAQAALAALEQRVAVLETSGGLIVRPSAPIDDWVNHRIHLERGEREAALADLEALFTRWLPSRQGLPVDAVLAWAGLAIAPGQDPAARVASLPPRVAPAAQATLRLLNGEPAAFQALTGLQAAADAPTRLGLQVLAFKALRAIAKPSHLEVQAELRAVDALIELGPALDATFVAPQARAALEDELNTRRAFWDPPAPYAPSPRELADPPAYVRWLDRRHFVVWLADPSAKGIEARVPGGEVVPLGPAGAAFVAPEVGLPMASAAGELASPEKLERGPGELVLTWTTERERLPGGTRATYRVRTFVPPVLVGEPDRREMRLSLGTTAPMQILVEPSIGLLSVPVAPSRIGLSYTFDPRLGHRPGLSGGLMELNVHGAPRKTWVRDFIALADGRPGFIATSARAAYVLGREVMLYEHDSALGTDARPHAPWHYALMLARAGFRKEAIDLALALLEVGDRGAWKATLTSETLTYAWLYLLAYASAERHRVAELARGLDALPGGRRAFASTAFVAHAAEHLLGSRPLEALLAEARERDQGARAKGEAESATRFEDEVAALRAIVAPGDPGTSALATPALGRLARETFELPVLTRWARDLALEAPPAVKNGARWIDRFEVTVDDWRGCERAGACRPLAPYACEPEAGGLTGFDLRTWWAGPHCFPLVSNPYPATWVPHADAKAFCRWRGGALPTRAEWQAARRPSGRVVRPELMGNTNDSFGCDLMPERDGIAQCDAAAPFDGFLGVAPVGSFPAGASAIGAQDLVGNAREWLDDGAVAGSSWLRPVGESDLVRPAERYADADLGFRCAYDEAPKGRAASAKAGSAPRLPRVGLSWKKVPAGVRKAVERRKDEVRVEADYAAFSDFRVPTCLRRKLSEPCLDLTGFGDRSRDKHRFQFPGAVKGEAPVAAFEVLETEVTREQWATVMEVADPSWERCAGCAATRVRAEEAEAFCKKVGGRLPTEDEWLWAVASGGDSAEASATRASTRGERGAAAAAKADKHGVRGLLGGVWEWLAPEGGRDTWLSDVVGGSFATPAEVVGPDARVTVHRAARSDFIGFRCLR